MNKVTTSKIRLGQTVLINGIQHVLIKKSKAFKASDYFLTFQSKDIEFTVVHNSNVKWVLAEIVAA